MTPLSAFLILVVPGLLVGSAFLAGSLFAMTRTPGDREPRQKPGLPGRLGPPLLLALAFWPADIGLNQWHALWPADGTLRFLAVALAAAVIGLVHSFRPDALVTAALRFVLGASIAVGLLSPVAEQYMPRPLLIALAAAAALWLPLVGAAVDRADRRLHPAALPAALVLAAFAGAPALFQSGYAGGAQLAAALGAMGAGLLVASVIRRRAWASLDGASTVWLALLGAIVLATYGYADVPAPWVLPLIALAPLGALAGLALRRAWPQVLAAAAASGIVAGAATFAAFASVPDDAGAPGYEY